MPGATLRNNEQRAAPFLPYSPVATSSLITTSLKLKRFHRELQKS